MFYFLMIRRPLRSILFPYTTLFRSDGESMRFVADPLDEAENLGLPRQHDGISPPLVLPRETEDRKSTRLNSSHQINSYAVFCLKKKTISMKHSLTNLYTSLLIQSFA